VDPPNGLKSNPTDVKVTHVTVPVTSSMVTSTTHIEFLDQLNSRSTIKAYAGDCSYVSNQCLLDRVGTGEEDELTCTGWGDPVLPGEGVDVTFAGQYYNFNEGDRAGWNNGVAVFTPDAWENTLEGMGGMVGYFSLFYNKEETANTLYLEGVKPRMECVSSNAAAYAEINLMGEPRPKVAWTSYYVYACTWGQPMDMDTGENVCGGWSIPKCGEYHTTAVANAGGDLMCAEDPYTNYLGDDFVAWATEADVFIYADGGSWEATYGAMEDVLSSLPACKNQRCYDVAKNGENDWFESRYGNPDVLTEDLTSVISSGRQFNYQTKFLRNVATEQRGTGRECRDPDETEVWESLADDCLYIDVIFDAGGEESGAGRCGGGKRGALLAAAGAAAAGLAGGGGRERPITR